MSTEVMPAGFYSWGERCAAVIRRPAEAVGPLPGVVLCHGFRGIKEWFLPEFAELFVTAGFVVLTFDYRGFGESEGARGRLFPLEQVEDIRNALTFLEVQPGIDPSRLVLWGTSFGAANVIVAAAADQRASAVVAQVGFGDWERAMSETMPPGRREELEKLWVQDREERVLTGVSGTVDPGFILDNDQSNAAFDSVARTFPQLKGTFPLEAVERIFEYKPETVVAQISPRPLLLIGTTQDHAVPVTETDHLYDAAREPKTRVIFDAGHYEIYHSPFRERAVQTALEFLAEGWNRD